MFKISLTICFIATCFLGFGQKYIKPFVGINFSNRILTSDNTVRKDSLEKADKMKAFPSAGIQFLFEKKPAGNFTLE